jgi:hypothetical protein
VAQQVITKFTDDLDGSEASGSVEFALDGRSYEIDLSEENASKLREALAPFVSAARRLGGDHGRGRQAGASAKPRSSSARSREEMAEMRRWLRDNGYQVSDRGRIPNEFIQAYESKTPAPGRSPEDNDTNGHAPVFQTA